MFHHRLATRVRRRLIQTWVAAQRPRHVVVVALVVLVVLVLLLLWWW